MPMRPSLVRFGLLAVALVVGGSACQAPPEPWPQSVERAPPLPYREPIAVATRESAPPERIAPIIERGTGSFVQRPPGPVTPAIARNAAGEVTLNVVDADLREVVRMVLQDALGVNYVIDPAVQGTVTVQTSEPVQAEDLEAILNAILRVNGAALVRTGDLYRVVPIDAALSSGAPPALQPLPDAGAPGFGIRVVPLRFATAAKMAELLAPFAPPAACSRSTSRAMSCCWQVRPPSWMRWARWSPCSTSTGWPGCRSACFRSRRRRQRSWRRSWRPCSVVGRPVR